MIECAVFVGAISRGESASKNPSKDGPRAEDEVPDG
jgi:hypothetical protein